MLRGTLTLLTRALRDAARLPRAHLLRLASVLILLGMLIEAHVSSGGVGAPGLRLFRWICYLSVALVSLAGLGFFAGAISEEKEDGTLGLLKLADLSTLSIVLGKSTSRLAIALVVFAGMLPFALLSITLGGLTVRQVFAAFVAIGAYMVLVANIALVWSVICRRTSAASLFLLLTLAVGLVVAPTAHRSRAGFEREKIVPVNSRAMDAVWGTSKFFDDNSVLTRIDSILTTGFSGSAFNRQVWLNLAGALACFVFACAIFDRFTEYVDSTAGGRRTGWRRLSVPRGRLRMWPLVWKDFHFIAGGLGLLIAKTVLYACLVVFVVLRGDWVYAIYGVDVTDAAWSLAIVIAVSELLLCAARILHSERVEGTLPCLLVLPRSLASISYAKLAGCLLGSVPTIVMIAVLVVLFPIRDMTHADFFDRAMPAAMLLLVLLHLTVLYSLIVRWGALPLAIGTLLVLSGCVGPILAMAVTAIYTSGHGPGGSFGPVLYTGIAISVALQIAIAVRLRIVAGQ